MVPHQTNDASIGRDLIPQPADRLGDIPCGAPVSPLDTAATSQGLDEHQPIGGSQLFGLLVRPLGRARFHWQGLTNRSLHDQRLFVKADQRSSWIIRLGRHIPHVFQGCHTGGINRWKAPVLLRPRFPRVFFAERAHRFWRDPSHLSSRDGLACEHASHPVVLSIRDRATSNGHELGRLLISQCWGSALLPCVGQHCLDASRAKALSKVADRLLRDVENLGDFGICPTCIAFQQHACWCEGSCLGFSTSHTHLHVVSFLFAEMHRIGSAHEIFSRFSSAYHTFQTGLTTSPLRL